MTDERAPATPESVDGQLARLRRLAVVETLLTTLVGTLDVREVFGASLKSPAASFTTTRSRCRSSPTIANTRFHMTSRAWRRAKRRRNRYLLTLATF